MSRQIFFISVLAEKNWACCFYCLRGFVKSLVASPMNELTIRFDEPSSMIFPFVQSIVNCFVILYRNSIRYITYPMSDTIALSFFSFLSGPSNASRISLTLARCRFSSSCVLRLCALSMVRCCRVWIHFSITWFRKKSITKMLQTCSAEIVVSI